MKKNVIFIALSLLIISTQISEAQKNNIKLNLTNAAFGDIRLGYEYALNDKQTLQLNAGMMIPRKLPWDVVDESVIEDYNAEVEILKKISGYSFSLEYRFYPGSKKEAPFGFYVAPYAKYNSYSLKLTQYFEYMITQEDWDSLSPSQKQNTTFLPSYNMWNVEATGTFVGNFNQAGVGVMFGWQWQLGANLTMDFNILGLGIESDATSLELTADDADIDYREWGADIENKVEEYMDGSPIVDRFIGGKVKVFVDPDKVRVETDRIFLPAARFSLSIGFSF